MRGIRMPSMNHLHHFLMRGLIVSLALTTLTCAPGFAEEATLISIGPRIGFTGKTPFLRKEQKYNFYLTDVAAVFRLP